MDCGEIGVFRSVTRLISVSYSCSDDGCEVDALMTEARHCIIAMRSIVSAAIC